ncbi:MAG: type II secretion system protein GspD [Verrucomicrobia bacterium]|nr:type II secretion system protein GspD [Verrucomicrobiota bacterium]MCF7709156.1 type II secretion system protein GspD [Verrucomicrobiota bacterium]
MKTTISSLINYRVIHIRMLCAAFTVSILFTGCTTTKESGRPTAPPPQYEEKTYSDVYDKEISQILDLARSGEWSEAEAKASALYAKDPDNSIVQRIYTWVKTESEKIREKKLEDEIRYINTKNSAFSPTPFSIVKEKRTHGLEPRRDLREAIEQINSVPYVPDSFGKTIRQKGTLSDFESQRGRMEEVLSQEITVHLNNVTLESIIFNIGEAEGINFIADRSLPAFNQKLSVNMDNVKLSEFLKFVSRNLGVSFQVGDGLVWIVDSKNADAFQETRFYRLRKGFILPAQFGPDEVTTVTQKRKDTTTVTETRKMDRFVQDGAELAPSIETAIEQFFEGEYYLDFERNLIVARSTPEQLDLMERIIEEFDKIPQQVLIEARFITVTEAAFLEMGASWETGRGTATQRTTRDYTGLGENVGLGLEETFLGVLGRDNLSLTLTALQQSGESEVLSSPRITVLNNLPAKISDGKIQYYYEEYTVEQTILERRSTSSLVPKGKPTKLTAGVSLDVLASIGGDGQSILLALRPEVNSDVELVNFATVTDRDDQGNVVSSFDIKLPQSRTQSIATRVVVKSGQTVVMGGVVQKEQKTYVESVPILGDIPFIGAAFRKRTEVNRPRYLLIFVTATLLSPTGEYIITADTE